MQFVFFLFVFAQKKRNFVVLKTSIKYLKMRTQEENIKLIRNLKLLLQNNFGSDIKDVILFGSQAKGNASELSDYDILIILKNNYNWKYRDKMTDVIYDMELQHDILFDKHLLTLHEIKHSLKASEPIYQNALKQGIYA